MLSIPLMPSSYLATSEPPLNCDGMRNSYADSGSRVDVTSAVLVIVLMTGKTVNGTVDNTSAMIHPLRKVLAPAVLVTDPDTPVYFLIR